MRFANAARHIFPCPHRIVKPDGGWRGRETLRAHSVLAMRTSAPKPITPPPSPCLHPQSLIPMTQAVMRINTIWYALRWFLLPYPRCVRFASGSMQDDKRSGGPQGAGPYGSQFKVAIPRLPARRAPPPTTPKSRQRDRVQRACRNCHKRSGSSIDTASTCPPHQPSNQLHQRSNAAAAFPAATIAKRQTRPVFTSGPEEIV